MSPPKSQFDFTPPHSIEAEKCLLAAMMLDATLIDEVYDAVPADEVFYLQDNAIIFRAIVDMRRDGRATDAVLVRAELGRRGQLDEVGGTAYLAELMHTVPTAAHGGEYLRVVMQRYRLRQVIAAANVAIRAAYGPDADGEMIAATLAQQAESIRDTGGADPVVSIGQAAANAVTQMRSGQLRRLLTGLNECDPAFLSISSHRSLDYIAGGLPLCGLTIIGGRPGSGKSQMVKSLAMRWAKAGTAVGVISVEEDQGKIARNMLANVSGDVPNWKIERDAVTNNEHRLLQDAAREMDGLPYFIDDTCSTLQQVESACRRLASKYGCKVLIIDHIHAIQHATNLSRNDQLTQISARLKAIFRRLGVIGICVAQLNRSNLDGEDSVPILTSLRESGALEQDGDLIMLLHRRDYYRTDVTQHDSKVEIHVAKNKGGGLGCAWAFWNGDRQSIDDWNDGRGPKPRFSQDDLEIL